MLSSVMKDFDQRSQVNTDIQFWYLFHEYARSHVDKRITFCKHDKLGLIYVTTRYGTIHFGHRHGTTLEVSVPHRV